MILRENVLGFGELLAVGTVKGSSFCISCRKRSSRARKIVKRRLICYDICYNLVIFLLLQKGYRYETNDEKSK